MILDGMDNSKLIFNTHPHAIISNVSAKFADYYFISAARSTFTIDVA